MRSETVTRAPSLPDHVPVLIVGAGPTGLLSANLLGTYGIETLLIEQNETTSDLPKAILLDDEGLRALQAVGLADDVVARVISGYGARYYAPDGSCFAEIGSAVTCHGYPRRNSFLQPELERILAKGLQQYAHVRIMFNTQAVSVSDGDDAAVVHLQLEDGKCHEITCAFVLACDGARSSVREQFRIPMPGMTDARDWVVIDTVNDPDRDRFSKFICDPARPMVSIPAPGGGRRYEFMILPGEAPQIMAQRDTIRSVLAQFRQVPDEDILRAVVYTFHARVADCLSIGRVALLGDAAHLSPPFAGQGMNAGLRDAFNVAWKLKLSLDGGASPRIVDTYEAERKGPITEMINYAIALGEIVMPLGGLDETAKREIRANLMGVQDTSGHVVSMRPKPEAIYLTGWRLPENCPAGKGMTGHVFPQFPVETPSGETCLLDEVLGPEFALVAIGKPAAAALSKVVGLDEVKLRLKRVNLQFDKPADKEESAGAIFATGDDFGLQAHKGSILLVRPDRYVAAQWNVDTAHNITSQIANLCARLAV